MVIILALFIPTLACSQETTTETYDQLTIPEAVIILYSGSTSIEDSSQHDFINELMFHTWESGIAVISINSNYYVVDINSYDTITFADGKYQLKYDMNEFLIINKTNEQIKVNSISLKAS